MSLDNNSSLFTIVPDWCARELKPLDEHTDLNLFAELNSSSDKLKRDYDLSHPKEQGEIKYG